MYVDTHERIVLPDPFRSSDAERLVQYCEDLGRSGQQRLVLDVSGVRDCDREGLACWQALAAGSCGFAVSIRGAHWSQFLTLLQTTPLLQVAPVCQDIRSLIATSSRHTGNGRGVVRTPA